MSPPLAGRVCPPGTKSFALICDDPDAPSGTWVHWVLCRLPAAVSSLAEKVEPPPLPNGAKQGANDFGKVEVWRSLPARGRAHHYFFKVYALDLDLALKPGPRRRSCLRRWSTTSSPKASSWANTSAREVSAAKSPVRPANGFSRAIVFQPPCLRWYRRSARSRIQ